jgi:hypothetical protein
MGAYVDTCRRVHIIRGKSSGGQFPVELINYTHDLQNISRSNDIMLYCMARNENILRKVKVGILTK